MDLAQLKLIVGHWAADEPLIRKAYIFGSRAKGTERSDSDLDVAVEVDRLAGDANDLATWLFEKDELSSRLQSRVPCELQLELFDPNNTPHVVGGVRDGGVLVYDQERAT